MSGTVAPPGWGGRATWGLHTAGGRRTWGLTPRGLGTSRAASSLTPQPPRQPPPGGDLTRQPRTTSPSACRKTKLLQRSRSESSKTLIGTSDMSKQSVKRRCEKDERVARNAVSDIHGGRSRPPRPHFVSTLHVRGVTLVLYLLKMGVQQAACSQGAAHHLPYAATALHQPWGAQVVSCTLPSTAKIITTAISPLLIASRCLQ